MAEKWPSGMDLPSSSRVFPGFEHVYLLGDPGTGRAFRAEIELTVEQAFSITRGEFHPTEPVLARWSAGSKTPLDLVRTGFAAPVLMNHRVIDLLTALGARGFGTYEIALLGKDKEGISGYQGFAVHGRCGRIDNSRSVESTKQYPGGVFPVWKGLYFDPATWDGSDVFMADGRTGWIFVVEAVKRAFEDAKVTNVKFEPLSEIERTPVEMKTEL